MKKPNLVIRLKDGTSIWLPIAKAASIRSNKKMLILEEMKSGDYRLNWTEGLIKEFSDIERFDIVRPSDEEIVVSQPHSATDFNPDPDIHIEPNP